MDSIIMQDYPPPAPAPAPAPIPMAASQSNGLPEDQNDSDSDDSASDHERPSNGLQSIASTEGRPLTGLGDRPPRPDTKSGIKERLSELEDIDDNLALEEKKIAAKRLRKDNKVAEKYAGEDAFRKSRRDMEDAAVKARRDDEDARISQMRAMKLERTRKRREREDTSFRHRTQAHEQEEHDLLRRLKNLKRGRPIDEGEGLPQPDRPPSTPLSPPAKRHQPSQISEPMRSPMPFPMPGDSQPFKFSQTLPPIQGHHPQPMQTTQNPQTQQTQQNPQTQPATEAAYKPQIQHNPPVQSIPPHQQSQQAPHVHQPAPQAQNTQTSGHPTLAPVQDPHWKKWPQGPGYPSNPPPNPFSYSPGGTFQVPSQPPPPNGAPRAWPAAPPIKYGPSPQPPSTAGNAPSSAATSTATHYDVHPPAGPPPMVSTGFQSINQPAPHTPASTPSGKAKGKGRAGLDTAVHHTPSHPPGTSVSPPNTASGKRKASTTHPYSQSEAFANRHHHCERHDALDRGVWTYYGPGGTKDNPTIPQKREMYLKCHHSSCNRIDWKTVHGLQCHIVKHHGVPKGTIGSLDLALEAYGVDVKQIEDYEKIHGFGSGGVIADKSSSRKSKKRQSNGTNATATQPTPAAANPTFQPSKPAPAPAPVSRPTPQPPSLHFPTSVSKGHNGGYVQEDIVFSEDESELDSVPSPKIAPLKIGARKTQPFDPVKTEAQNSASPVEKTATEPRTLPLAMTDESASFDRPQSPQEKPVQTTEVQSMTATTAPSAPLLKIPDTPESQAQESVEEPSPTNDTASNDVPPASPEKSEPTSQIVTLKVGKTLQRLAGNALSISETASPSPSIDSTPPPPKTTSNTNSLSRPRDRNPRIPASARWEWAPVTSSSGSEDDRSMPSSRRRKDRTTSAPSFADARDELQGPDEDDDEMLDYGSRELRDRGMGGPRSAGFAGMGVRFSERAAKKPRKRYNYED